MARASRFSSRRKRERVIDIDITSLLDILTIMLVFLLQSYNSSGVTCLIDTAGRLHTNQNLMDELIKTKKVMAKIDAMAPSEVLLVLDAITGQNALKQAQEFHKNIFHISIAAERDQRGSIRRTTSSAAKRTLGSTAYLSSAAR